MNDNISNTVDISILCLVVLYVLVIMVIFDTERKD